MFAIADSLYPTFRTASAKYAHKFTQKIPPTRDMYFVGSFLRHAEEIFDTATGAAGEDCRLAILMSAGGGIHMIDASGWNLESLRRHHGADSAFLVTRENGQVSLEARAAGRHCTMRAEAPAARLRPAMPECPVTMRTWLPLPAPTPQVY